MTTADGSGQPPRRRAANATYSGPPHTKPNAILHSARCDRRQLHYYRARANKARTSSALPVTRRCEATRPYDDLQVRALAPSADEKGAVQPVSQMATCHGVKTVEMMHEMHRLAC
jgi:hypothetical protein